MNIGNSLNPESLTSVTDVLQSELMEDTLL